MNFIVLRSNYSLKSQYPHFQCVAEEFCTLWILTVQSELPTMGWDCLSQGV